VRRQYKQERPPPQQIAGQEATATKTRASNETGALKIESDQLSRDIKAQQSLIEEFDENSTGTFSDNAQEISMKGALQGLKSQRSVNEQARINIKRYGTRIIQEIEQIKLTRLSDSSTKRFIENMIRNNSPLSILDNEANIKEMQRLGVKPSDIRKFFKDIR